MNLEYRIVEQPEEEPVTLEAARRHTRAFAEDADEDAYIQALIVAAREWVEAAVCRSLVTRTVEARFDAFPTEYTPRNYAGRYPVVHASGHPCQLLYPPLQSVVSITYGADATVLDPEAYEVVPGTPGVIRPVGSWPSEGPVIVQFVAGYGEAADIPQRAKLAISMLVSAWYEQRAAISQATLSEVPFAVNALLSTLRWGAYP